MENLTRGQLRLKQLQSQEVEKAKSRVQMLRALVKMPSFLKSSKPEQAKPVESPAQNWEQVKAQQAQLMPKAAAGPTKMAKMSSSKGPQKFKLSSKGPVLIQLVKQQ